MLSDPQSVTINAVATTLPRVQLAPSQNTYQSADGNVALVTKQNVTKTRFRREVRLTQKKVAADPLTAVNAEKGISVYCVIDEPRAGFSDVEIGYLVESLKSWLTAANYNKVLGGEM